MRITKIKNDLLSIGEVIGDREITLIGHGGLTREWDVFNTTILKNERILGFYELLAKCTHEEIRMMERDNHSNGNNPTTFSAHAKRKKNVCPTIRGQGFKMGFKEGRQGRFFNRNGFCHFPREFPHKKDTPRDDENHNNKYKGNGNQRNNMFNTKGKRNAPAARNGNGRPPEKSINSRYEEFNVGEKENKFYLISSLTTTSPLDTLDNWLIDSGASRHFIGYKEAL